MYSKFSFLEVYPQIYGWKLSLWQRASGAKKVISDLISDDMPPQMKIVNMDIPIQPRLEFERCKPQKAARHPTKCDVFNDVKLFPTVYRCHNFLSNQTSRYKSKCIRNKLNGLSRYELLEKRHRFAAIF